MDAQPKSKTPNPTYRPDADELYNKARDKFDALKESNDSEARSRALNEMHEASWSCYKTMEEIRDVHFDQIMQLAKSARVPIARPVLEGECTWPKITAAYTAASESIREQEAERNLREKRPYAQPDGLIAFADGATNVRRTINEVNLKVPTCADGSGRIVSTDCILVIEERDATEKEPRSVHVCFTRPPKFTGPITNIIESLITCVYNERFLRAGYAPEETHYYEYSRSGHFTASEHFCEVKVQWEHLSPPGNAPDKRDDLLERFWENVRNTSNLTTSELLTPQNIGSPAIVVGVEWKYYSKVPRLIGESRNGTPSVLIPEPKSVLSANTERPSTDIKRDSRTRPM